jgi:hypothetical protein
MVKHVQEDPMKKPSNFLQNTFKKFKRKDKKIATLMREGGKLSCTHCKKSVMMKNIVGNGIQKRN